jgi:hypothetical protein
MRRTARVSTLILTLGTLSIGCSGSGVSTTARTDSGADDGTEGTNSADGGPGDAANEDGDAGSGDEGTEGGDATSQGDEAGDDTADDTGAADTTPDTGNGDDTGGEPVALEGTWLSEGDDVAPLLINLTGAVSITATFDDVGFTVVTIDDEGQEVMQTGVYTATEVGDVYEILLEQSTPQTITAAGIYQIDNSVSPPVMRYEVLQTEPDVNAGPPPTAEGGFGATQFRADLTQVFVRQ